MKAKMISEMGTVVENHCNPKYSKDILLIIFLVIVLYYTTVLFRKLVKFFEKLN